jgi:required for meiotic nuclear division protein 1
MPDAQATPINLSSRARYAVHTYSVPEKLNLKQVADVLFPGVTERLNADCLVFHHSNTEKIFIFIFGTVVFFNIPVRAHENYLSRLGIKPHKKVQIDASTTNAETQDGDDLAEDEVTINVEPGVTEVGFNTVTVPEFDLSLIQMVAQVLAQSSALELIEWEVEEFIAQSEKMTKFLQGRKFERPRRVDLLRFLGLGLSAKHRIVNQLALLNEPEKTWEKEELYRFYKDLFSNFEIRERIEKVEKMLDLCSDVSELLLEIVNARRAEIMEMTIIALIAVELVKSVLGL